MAPIEIDIVGMQGEPSRARFTLKNGESRTMSLGPIGKPDVHPLLDDSEVILAVKSTSDPGDPEVFGLKAETDWSHEVTGEAQVGEHTGPVQFYAWPGWIPGGPTVKARYVSFIENRQPLRARIIGAIRSWFKL